MAKHHLTKSWYDKLLKDLDNLKNKELPEILERLKTAIEQWDLSENAEYEQAMEDRSMVEKKISELQSFLEDVEIIEWASIETVWYGNKVEIERDWKIEQFEIVGSWEVDVFSNKISLHSPLWIALRDKKVWDKVKVKSPKGVYEVKILSISL